MSRPVIDQTRIEECAREMWEKAGRPQGGPEAFHQKARDELRAAEKDYDKTLADSFPASDPPAHSGVTGSTVIKK